MDGMKTSMNMRMRMMIIRRHVGVVTSVLLETVCLAFAVVGIGMGVRTGTR